MSRSWIGSSSCVMHRTGFPLGSVDGPMYYTISVRIGWNVSIPRPPSRRCPATVLHDPLRRYLLKDPL